MTLDTTTALRLQRLAPGWQRAGALIGVAALMTACGGGNNPADDTTSVAATSPSLAAPLAGPAPAPAPGMPAAPSPAPAADATPAAKSPPRAPAPAPAPAVLPAPTPAPAPVPVSARDAVRLADQATFGATEPLVSAIQSAGLAGWVSSQMGIGSSRYTSGGDDAFHRHTGSGNYCDNKTDCWRDYGSTEPLVWDFYRNAMNQPDQLRQRVAFALQQIVVVNSLEVEGTYGFRVYYNTLLDNAFGNYRQVLKKVAMSPVMGDFLNNANNDKAAPNENFARELLQLFSIGTCALNLDGSLQGGGCVATYTNDVVRSYAYAMTGWTYPVGGTTSYGCWPSGTNCRYYGGDMVPLASYHDTLERKLLANVTVAAGTAAAPALEKVLDSLMAHPNIAPFIGKQLIQRLVSSNPSPAYVTRVANAFNSGKYGGFGTGAKGDLAATVAAVLLDDEARGSTVARTAGKLREPALMFTGVLRALGGKTDGEALSWWWGDSLRQHVFRPPSVFNFFPPTYPVAGTTLVGPEYGIHNASAALERLNYLTYLLDWDGSAPSGEIPNSIGTKVDLSAFVVDAPDAAKLVDRLSLLAMGQGLPAVPRQKVIDAVSWWTTQTDSTNWKTNRVKTAAYLVFGSPNYQVQR